jgi:dolichol-phosphate mannosyltransferase
MPGRLFGSVGVGLFFLGAVIGVYLTFVKFYLGESIGNRPLLTVGVLFLILGVQLFMTGLLGELLMRIYFDTGDKEIYTLKEEVNFD